MKMKEKINVLIGILTVIAVITIIYQNNTGKKYNAVSMEKAVEEEQGPLMRITPACEQ
jgi:uncharacterized membrane protein